MSSDHESSTASETLASRLQRETGVRAADCYQCGKCTAGCPAVSEMDHAPSELMRMVQMELPEYETRALASRGIWMCLGCDACATRCPKDVNMPAALDFLRQEAMARHVEHTDARDILAFHRSFLASIENHGRLYELGLVLGYKFRTGHFLQDVDVAPSMYFKGKLGILPHNVEDTAAVQTLFARVKASGKRGDQ